MGAGNLAWLSGSRWLRNKASNRMSGKVLLMWQPVTRESIATAIAARDAERLEVERLTGVRIAEDGRIRHDPASHAPERRGTCGGTGASHRIGRDFAGFRVNRFQR